MKIPDDAIIPVDKFSRYLLVKREFDDISTATIVGDTVNDWIQKIRASGLRFSFKRAKESAGQSTTS